MNISCCVVDDEPLARAGIVGYIAKIPYLNCMGEFNSAIDLLSEMEALNPDLLFLDIEMPHLTGLELIKNLKHPPKVIFTTAYDQYALEGFELDVLDYLMKPISFDRFLKATERAKSFFKEQNDSFFVKTDKRMERVKFNDILYLESMQNYVIIHCASKRLITHNTLKSIFDLLPKSNFSQIHKQYIVNNSRVSAIEGNQVLIQNVKLPISRSHRSGALNTILGD
ncbi:LytTR family DNA-binding domain-containing protein [Ekhidna sp.]|uniref:LytR/AlgR family response regulator transcription factor n=1 Tax=Ekhidna sp. TaxID=2608089 RepID=UPI0032972C7F